MRKQAPVGWGRRPWAHHDGEPAERAIDDERRAELLAPFEDIIHEVDFVGEREEAEEQVRARAGYLRERAEAGAHDHLEDLVRKPAGAGEQKDRP
jgi:hypothetical protein